MQISNKLWCFGVQKFCKPTRSVYHDVLLDPCFESTGHGPETVSRSSTYADFSEATFHTRSWAYRYLMAC